MFLDLATTGLQLDTQPASSNNVEQKHNSPISEDTTTDRPKKTSTHALKSEGGASLADVGSLTNNRDSVASQDSSSSKTSSIPPTFVVDICDDDDPWQTDDEQNSTSV